jgi:hypothetical protein
MNRHLSIPAAGAVSAPIIDRGQKSTQIGFLERFMEALHYSRRIQARRFLTSHRHLVGNGQDVCLSSDREADYHVDR